MVETFFFNWMTNLNLQLTYEYSTKYESFTSLVLTIFLPQFTSSLSLLLMTDR